MGGAGGGGGGGGGGNWYDSPMFQQLMGQYQGAYDEARAANEARYQEMLGLSEGLGQADREAIERQMRGAQSGAGQQTVTSGLSNVPGAVQGAKAIASQPYLTAQGRLQDSLRREQIGIRERRTDAYPDMNQFINLAQRAGRYSNQYASAQPASRPGWGMPGGGRSMQPSRGGGVFYHA